MRDTTARIPVCAATSFFKSPTVSDGLHFTRIFLPRRSFRITSIIRINKNGEKERTTEMWRNRGVDKAEPVSGHRLLYDSCFPMDLESLCGLMGAESREVENDVNAVIGMATSARSMISQFHMRSTATQFFIDSYQAIRVVIKSGILQERPSLHNRE